MLVFGGYLLVWADNNGLVVGNQLFSPWSLPLYAGFLAASFLLFIWWDSRRNLSRIPFPGGLRYSLVGAALFIVGLLVEFVLREAGGRPPAGPEGVLTPSRLLLFAATLLILTGPVLSIVERRATSGSVRGGWRHGLPTLGLALGLMLAVLTLLTQSNSPHCRARGRPSRGSRPDADPDRPVPGAHRRHGEPAPDHDTGLLGGAPRCLARRCTVAYAAGTQGDFRLYTIDLGTGPDRPSDSERAGRRWSCLGARRPAAQLLVSSREHRAAGRNAPYAWPGSRAQPRRPATAGEPERPGHLVRVAGRHQFRSCMDRHPR